MFEKKKLTFDSENLLAKLLCVSERLVLGDREDADESFATSEVVIPNGRVIFLASSICGDQNGQRKKKAVSRTLRMMLKHQHC